MLMEIYMGEYPEVALAQVSGEDRLRVSAETQKLYKQVSLHPHPTTTPSRCRLAIIPAKI